MPAILSLTGLGCCHHLYYLLDKNQSHLVPSDDVLSYRMKARFYFQVTIQQLRSCLCKTP